MSFAHPSRRRTVSPSWGGGGSSSRNTRPGRSVPTSPPFGSGGGGGSGSGGNWSGAGSGESRRHEQELINAYEAEEERIINVLSRKLEQLREDKIDLENALEAESESHVNRLARELGALRTANGELEAQLAEARRALSSADEHLGEVVIGGPAATSHMSGWAGEPSMGLVLDALRRENEVLRQQLADSQRNYVRISRFNELYREELIEHRTRLGLSVDSLVGLTSADRDPFAHATHQRSRSSSASSSPAVSLYAHTHTNNEGSTRGSVPIPRPLSQIHRPPLHVHSHMHNQPSTSSTPLSLSPSSPSAYPSLSPIYSTSASVSASASTTSSSTDSSFLLAYPHHRGHHHNGHHGRRRRYSAASGSGTSAITPASFVSVSTTLTSPPGSMPNGNGFAALGLGMGMGMGTPRAALTYPSVPPPSLSSSFGSPTVAMHVHLARDGSSSPVGVRSRRSSAARPLGARVAETGSLAGRSRAGSLAQHAHAAGMPETVVEGEGDDEDAGYEDEDGDGEYADAGGSEYDEARSQLDEPEEHEQERRREQERDDEIPGMELGTTAGVGERNGDDHTERNGAGHTRAHGPGPAMVQAGGVLVPTALMRAPRTGAGAPGRGDGEAH